MGKKQVVKTDGKVAQSHHIAGNLGSGNAAGIFAKTDIPNAVSSVFNGRPVPDDRFKQPFIVEFIFCFTTHIVGDLGDRHLLLPRQSEVNGDPFDGNDAPATAETDFLGTDLQSLDAAAYQFAVAFIPRNLILRRKKK